MKVTNLKEFELLVKACRKLGIDHFKGDGFEFVLTPKPKKQRRNPLKDNGFVSDPIAFAIPKANTPLPTPEQGIKEAAMQLATDGLTPEQLLFYSTQSGAEQ